jgi:hypothetical protein
MLKEIIMFERYINEESDISHKKVTVEQWGYFLTNLGTVDLDRLTTGILEFYTDYHKEAV